MSYRTTVLAPGLWAIDEGMVQCFLVEGEERALLIDSCMSGGADFTSTVLDLLSDRTKPLTLVLTHSDGDHTGGQVDFLPAFMHPAEFARYVTEGNSPTDVRALWEGERLDLGGVVLEALLLSGHTPGSLALLDRANRRLFVGDTLSDAMIFLYGEGRNVPAFIESLRRLEQRLEREMGGAGNRGEADTFGAAGAGGERDKGGDKGGDRGTVLLSPQKGTGEPSPCPLPSPCPFCHQPLLTLHSAHGSLSLGTEWIPRTRIAAEKLLAGELEGHPPANGSDSCLVYSYEGVNLLYDAT